MNSKLPSMFTCFLPYLDSQRENMGKQIGQKILPKDSKRMRPLRIFGILGFWQYENYHSVIWIAHAWS
jgi:hypothetical protein